jgi:hypothetical protein
LPALATLPKELARELVNSLGMKLVLIPTGKFLMGSPDSEADHRGRRTVAASVPCLSP